MLLSKNDSNANLMIVGLACTHLAIMIQCFVQLCPLLVY